jgi:hypothetical protein
MEVHSLDGSALDSKPDFELCACKPINTDASLNQHSKWNLGSEAFMAKNGSSSSKTTGANEPGILVQIRPLPVGAVTPQSVQGVLKKLSDEQIQAVGELVKKIHAQLQPGLPNSNLDRLECPSNLGSTLRERSVFRSLLKVPSAPTSR